MPRVVGQLSERSARLRILYLADPTSIHDLKWMMPDGPPISRFLLLRERHWRDWSQQDRENWEHRYGIRTIGSIPDFSIRRIWTTLKSIHLLRTLIQKFNIDIFHILFAEPNALWASARPYLGIPIVVTTRGTDILKTIPQFFQRRDLLSILVRMLYRRAFGFVDRFTSTSAPQREAIDAILPGARIKSYVVRTGVDVKLIENNDNMCSLPPEKATILFPRMMQPLYNHELALDAIRVLPEELRKRYRFTFLNSDSCNREYVYKIQAKMDEIDAEFHFRKTLPPALLQQAISRAALVVMTPLSDGSPVTAAETLLLRTPLILPPLDYEDELFGEAFRLADWNPISLSQLMQDILEQDCSERIQRGYEAAAANFSREREMAKVWQIYLELTPRKIAPHRFLLSGLHPPLPAGVDDHRKNGPSI